MIRALIRWLRFGNITTEVRAMDGSCASEVAYFGRFHRLIGYWAYGSFDPSMPYRGDWE